MPLNKFVPGQRVAPMIDLTNFFQAVLLFKNEYLPRSEEAILLTQKVIDISSQQINGTDSVLIFSTQ
jgi:hypothetical protein